MTCPICYEDFSEDRMPVIVCKEGHTCCRNCWSVMAATRLCPICRRKSLAEIVPNRALLDVIREKDEKAEKEEKERKDEDEDEDEYTLFILKSSTKRLKKKILEMEGKLKRKKMMERESEEKERIQKEEQDRLRRERERKEEEDRLRRERERKEEEDRLRRERERKKEGDRLRRERERKKEEDRLRRERERKKEEDRLRLEIERKEVEYMLRKDREREEVERQERKRRRREESARKEESRHGRTARSDEFLGYYPSTSQIARWNEGERRVKSTLEPLPLPEIQLRALEEVSPAKVGSIMYVLEKGWFCRWKSACERGEQIKVEAFKNDVLCIPNFHALRSDIMPNEDYVTVPQSFYTRILHWYGGGPHFPRKVIRRGRLRKIDVKLVLRNGHLLGDSENRIIIFQFSRFETISDIISMMAQRFGLTGVRGLHLWMFVRNGNGKYLGDVSCADQIGQHLGAADELFVLRRPVA